jgi:serine/threonine protein kinase
VASVGGFESDNDIADLVLQRKIGHGSFGDVFLADSKTYGVVAVKLLPANKVQIAKMAASFKKEIALMKYVSVPTYLRTCACL